jgi:CheY-like chemotaxis protein
MLRSKRLFTTRKYRDCGILIVEDHETVLEILAEYLGFIGYRHVWTAKDSGEALEILDNNPGSIHVILLDINLPGMNGLDFFQHLMRSHKFPVAIIITTAHRISAYKRRFFELGNETVLAFRYITKPVLPKVIRRALRPALRRISELRGRE